MFDTARLKTEWEAHMQAPMAPGLMELTQFFHVDFESPEYEQLIGIVRGAREDFSGVLRFWVRASTAGEAFVGKPGPAPNSYVQKQGSECTSKGVPSETPCLRNTKPKPLRGSTQLRMAQGHTV